MSTGVIDVTEEQAIEERALSLPEQARAILIGDAETYQVAACKLLDVAALRKQIQEHHAPLKKKAFEAHRAICDAEAKLLQPVAEAERILKAAIGAYDTEQRRKAEEERRRLEEEARRQQEEMIEAAIEEAEASGAPAEVVRAIVEQPVAAPVVRSQFSAPKVSGVSTRWNYRAQVADIRLLCRAVAEGKASPEFVLPNQTALNKLASAMRETFNIPGCQVVKEPVVATGRGRSS